MPYQDEVILGDCRLILGDCLEVMRDIPDESVDAVVTDLRARVSCGMTGKGKPSCQCDLLPLHYQTFEMERCDEPV